MDLDITTPHGYDVACALRGPDLGGCGALKRALTCRIRFLVGTREAPIRRRELTLFEAEAALAEAMRLEDKAFHYLCHVVIAARHLGDNDLSILADRLMYASGRKGLTPKKVVELAGGRDQRGAVEED